jgi:hypothetical protein
MAEDNDPTMATGERRARARYYCTLKAARVGDETVTFKPAKLARVINISTGGIGVHLGEPFDVGVVLTVRLHSFTGLRISPAMDVRVVHTSKNENGTWVLGMAFAEELSEAELQAWLAIE